MHCSKQWSVKRQINYFVEVIMLRDLVLNWGSWNGSAIVFQGVEKSFGLVFSASTFSYE